jgi:DNA-binding MarR family transcriptional regulator
MTHLKTSPKKSPDEDDPIGDSVESATRVLRQFRIVFNAVKTHFRQVEKNAGMGGAQVWALSLIQSHPGLGLTDLARGMDVHQSTASNLVKTLLQRKLISTEKGEPDRRAICLYLTEDGAAALTNAPAPFSGVLPDALASLDLHTLQCLEKDLSKLIDVLEADPASARTPLADL